MAVM